jgi:hypothetical protein
MQSEPCGTFWRNMMCAGKIRIQNEINAIVVQPE